MNLRLLTTTLFATLGFSVASAAEAWTEDFAAAKELAAKEKKDLLMDFTGSDWCGWCIKLRKEVFDKPEFAEEAPKSFVLVELDYPQQKQQDEKIKTQNQKLQETYTVEGFPTIILADATGRAYAKTGYAAGGPTPYLKSLSEMRATREKRDAAFAKAEKAEGLEKAKAIDEGLKALDPEIVDAYYDKEIESIISLDKEDTLGRKKGFEVAKAGKELQETLESLHGEKKFEEFGKTIDDFIAKWKLEGMEKQRLLMNKFAIYGPDKLDEAEKTADEVIKVDPESQIGKQAKGIKGQIAEMRKKGPSSKKGKTEEVEEAAEEKVEEKPKAK